MYNIYMRTKCSRVLCESGNAFYSNCSRSTTRLRACIGRIFFFIRSLPPTDVIYPAP